MEQLALNHEFFGGTKVSLPRQLPLLLEKRSVKVSQAYLLRASISPLALELSFPNGRQCWPSLSYKQIAIRTFQGF
jgi:hypothetical protein